MHIHTLHTSIKEIQTKLTINNQKHEKHNHGAIPALVSLKLGTLA